MQFLEAFHQPKAHPELTVQRMRVVSHNIKSAALFGTFRSKSAYDHMSTRFHRVGGCLNIASPLLGLGEEVKHCAIVPHIVALGKQADLSDISDEPLNLFRCRSQTFSGYVNRSF